MLLDVDPIVTVTGVPLVDAFALAGITATVGLRTAAVVVPAVMLVLLGSDTTLPTSACVSTAVVNVNRLELVPVVSAGPVWTPLASGAPVRSRAAVRFIVQTSSLSLMTSTLPHSAIGPLDL